MREIFIKELPFDIIDDPKYQVRFWWKVDKAGKTEDECWLWGGNIRSENRPRVKIEGLSYYAIRLAYYFEFGEDPGDLFCCHTCDNHYCVNPNHLWLGDHDANMEDRDNKGRNADRKGENHHMNTLTEEDVLCIRRLHSEEHKSMYEIARLFNVTDSNIWRIINRVTWKHI